MADKTTAPNTPDTTTTTPDDEGPSINNWEFLDRAPTRAEVVELLESVPPVYGVSLVVVADHVQALPQKKNVTRTNPNNGATYKQSVTSHTLYVSVAGRLALLQRIAEHNGWSVEFQPEPKTPTGIPGFLQYDDRLVYREYLVIHTDGDGDPERMLPLGRRPGTAWVPARGGTNAAGTNPFEKVETSARGRAIAAWGIGVLPGSGVASLEEIQAANQRAREATTAHQNEPRRSRADLISDARTMSEQIRQARELSDGDQADRVAERLTQIGAKLDPNRSPGDPIDWEALRDGHLQLICNDFKASLAAIRNATN